MPLLKTPLLFKDIHDFFSIACLFHEQIGIIVSRTVLSFVNGIVVRKNEDNPGAFYIVPTSVNIIYNQK